MEQIALLGFGEAAQAFACAAAWPGAAAFDIKTLSAATRREKLADFTAVGVIACETLAEAAARSLTLLSLVSADQALAAAEDVANLLSPGTLYFDMNSVSPGTKRFAATVIERAGGRYVDVAIMAPVLPARLAVPILVSGPHAHTAAASLASAGFTNVEKIGNIVGEASATKMIRSVLVKGIEAATAECLIAADAAGLTEAVMASLGADWANRADYNLDRMLVHGLRRAAEMEEVSRTLEELGVNPRITDGAAQWQRALGELAVRPIPIGLAAKLAAIGPRAKQDISCR